MGAPQALINSRTMLSDEMNESTQNGGLDRNINCARAAKLRVAADSDGRHERWFMKEHGHLGCVGVLETMAQWFNLVPKSPLWLKLSGWWVNMMVEVCWPFYYGISRVDCA